MSGETCGNWMPRKQTYCARRPGHRGPASAPRGWRGYGNGLPTSDRLRVITAEDRERWNRAYRLKQFGLTLERFQGMLGAQGYASAMCHEPFEADQRIAIDHDHACCPDSKRSCGRCVRALLHPQCNLVVGYVEQYSEMVRAYLQSPQMRSMRSDVSVMTGRSR